MIRALANVLSIFFLVAVTMPAAARQDEPENPPNEAVQGTEDEEATEEGRVFRDQIVVTPGRQEQASGDAPAPITVFDRETIEKIQPEKMADLFKMVPGVEIDGEGPFRGLPVIRGLSSNRVLILVDGQRLNNSRESTTFAGIQPALVNLAEVERIEVLRGPASVQYGSDAIGGVVNIITRQPNLGAQDFKVSGEAAFEYGTISDSQLGRASVTGTGQGFSFYAGATYEKVDEYTAADGASQDERYAPYVRADNSVPNSGMEQTNFNGGLKFMTGQQGVLRIDAEVVRTKDVGFPGFSLDTNGIEFTFPNFDRDKIGVSWSAGPVWGLSDISLSTYYQAVNKESASIFDFPGFFSDSFTQSEINSFGFNAQSIAHVGRHHLTFGIDLYIDNVDDTTLDETCFGPSCLPPSTEVAVPRSEQTGLGVYIQDGWSLSDSVTLQLGLRGDTFSFVSEDDPDYLGEPFDETDSAVSGNLGVTWSVTDHVNLNALVARGFRTPNLQERSYFGLATNGEAYILQNPGLSSESSWNYEIGTKVRYERYSGGLHLFYNDLSDFITLEFLDLDDPICASPPAPPGIQCAEFANIAKATIKGVEFDLEAIFANWWTAFGSIAYMEGDNESTGEPLSTIPPLKVLLGLRYQRSAWWTEANLRFLDRQTDLPEDDPFFDTGTVGFTVYDLRGGFDFDFGLGFIASVENITDKLYNEPFNNRPEPGRNFRVTARYRF
ncbi:MAG: TonB-dependent receptor [Acidobacteria bacterium]|nr:TonB-dependent receptor [Acidobacteriota bacterium]